MTRLIASVRALLSHFRPSRGRNASRGRGRPARRRNVLGNSICEHLEVRIVPSANPIVATALPINGFETAPLTNIPVATFTAGNGSEPASNFATSIAWGDGTTSAGTVVQAANGTYVVFGSHTFSDVSQMPVIVGIVDATAPANTAIVSDSTLIAPVLPDGTQGTADQRYVYEVLKDLLERPISMAEVNYWTGQYQKNHLDRQTFVSIVIEDTPPYEYRRGEIESAYETYLHRAADIQGENYFLQLVINLQGTRSGPGTERRTAALLINSDEFYNLAGDTVDGFITAVFEDALKRAPSASDLAYFSYQLTHGMTHIEFATQVLNSNEFLTRSYNSLYERYLGRPIDPAGLAAFINNVQLGYGTESNTETLLDTDEFYNRAVGLPLDTVDS
ncbi:MAG TPA: DUF4214 domain-containing protein [Pirellulales bacterium]|nr:DUF4214 domain-containing protein [Pirellulales bacterium]